MSDVRGATGDAMEDHEGDPDVERFDLKFFFRGMQNRETAASAWLATMLEHRPSFRRAFLGLIPADPPLDPLRPWHYDIETELSGPCDVTLEDDEALIFIENKVAASAKTEDQLLRYFRGAARDSRANKRLVGVYLGPTAATGEDERRRVVEDGLFAQRAAGGRGDVVACIGWKDNIDELVEASTAADDWLARTGRDAILQHIAKLETGRPPNPQRIALEQLMDKVAGRIGGQSPGSPGTARLYRWPSVGQEALYTPSRAVTVWLTILFAEDDQEPYELHGVVVDDEIHLRRATVSVNPSTRLGRRDPELMARWRTLTAGGSVEVPGIGPMTLVNDVSLQAGREFHGPAAVLEELLTSWGIAGLKFARSVESNDPALANQRDPRPDNGDAAVEPQASRG